VKTGLKITLNSHRATSAIILIVWLIVFSLLVVPVFSASALKCSSCHGSFYNQQLKFQEGNSLNSIPSIIRVGETLNVTVALENIDNASRYFLLSDVSVSLTSNNNHFSVNSSIFTIGIMAPGTVTANWQITGTSLGSDNLVITATGVNEHGHVLFSDAYLPSPAITINGTYSSTLTSGGTSSPTPPATNSSSAFPASSSTLGPSSSPEPTPTTINHNHKIDSSMLYIHPPLAIAGYFFIFLSTVTIIKEIKNRKITTILCATAWSLTALGLLTGMIWAQTAWGNYWSWDPKETSTLALFLAFSVALLAYIERKPKITKWSLILSCILVTVTGLSSFITTGLHSFT
jgi:hypothetical protein